MRQRIDPLIAERAAWLFRADPASRMARRLLDRALGYDRTIALGERYRDLTQSRAFRELQSTVADIRQLQAVGTEFSPFEGKLDPTGKAVLKAAERGGLEGIGSTLSLLQQAGGEIRLGSSVEFGELSDAVRSLARVLRGTEGVPSDSEQQSSLGTRSAFEKSRQHFQVTLIDEVDDAVLKLIHQFRVYIYAYRIKGFRCGGHKWKPDFPTSNNG
mgnify:CR=1 FL=1